MLVGRANFSFSFFVNNPIVNVSHEQGRQATRLG